jgi:DNA-binding winged helix-turn-helix (wHTH) protein
LLVPAGYVFGPFTLDCRKQRLLRDGEPLALTGKTFEVLRALIEHRERLVEKDELLRLVWPDVVVDEANLTQHIFTVRKLLGDSSQNARYVLTVFTARRRSARWSRSIAAHVLLRSPRELTCVEAGESLWR